MFLDQKSTLPPTGLCLDSEVECAVMYIFIMHYKLTCRVGPEIIFHHFKPSHTQNINSIRCDLYTRMSQ